MDGAFHPKEQRGFWIVRIEPFEIVNPAKGLGRDLEKFAMDHTGAFDQAREIP